MEKAILETLYYADIFDYPLTLEETHQFLIKKKADLNQVRSILGELVLSGSVGSRDGYYFLPGRAVLVDKRKGRKKWSQLKFKKAKKVSRILKAIPWIKLIAITGALAVENSSEEDDIDLLFITSPNRLWLSRGLVVVFLRLFGLYRRDDKIKDQICPNIWLTFKTLKFEDENLFVAHEISQIFPLFERAAAYSRLIEVNLWLKRFLPNWEMTRVNSKKRLQGRISSRFLRVPFFDWLNSLSFKLQRWYMRGKITRETVEKERALFHPLGTKDIILKKFAEKSSLKEA